jgi:hypothetical protein
VSVKPLRDRDDEVGAGALARPLAPCHGKLVRIGAGTVSALAAATGFACNVHGLIAPFPDGPVSASVEDGGATHEGGGAPSQPPSPEADRDYPSAVLADKPLAYWRLGETSGSVAKDEIGRPPGNVRR